MTFDMPFRFIGYAIVSQDGMLADAEGVIPPPLVVKADQDFFMRGLDAAAALIHGRNSAEQPTSATRRRLIATHRIQGTEAVTNQPHVRLWNPAEAPVEKALADLGVSDGEIAIIGGTDIFGLFLPKYDVFHLTRVPKVAFPGGRPVFPRVPGHEPEALLAQAGLTPLPPRILDPVKGVSVVSWTRGDLR